jgi:lipopolysaccharide transport protein LptA
LKLRLRIILRSNLGKQLLFVSALPLLIMLSVFAGTQDAVAAPETIGPNDTNHTNNRIRITADKLVAEVDAAEIIFIGNVKTARADAVITSDRLKIIYDPDAIKNRTRGDKKESIKKIIAKGHVKIVTDDIIAETDMAEYTIESKILVLLGEQSRVRQGGQSITGAKFTLYRTEGKLSVESNGENRIRAIVQP